MKVTNLSSEPDGVVHEWLPHDLVANDVVILPDACPSSAPLPTGAVIRTTAPQWRKWAVSDVGCGMRMLRTSLASSDVTRDLINQIVSGLKRNKGLLGDLGGGNHFVDFLRSRTTDVVSVLIHTGSRNESGLVDKLVDKPRCFDEEFAQIVGWAAANRAAVADVVRRACGPLQEVQADGSIVIRKGAVRANEGTLNVIPSHLAGDVALVRATASVSEILNSLSHGTGRRMSRSDAKDHARDFDFASLREQVMMPDCLTNASLRTEGPYAYRELDDCLNQLDGFAKVMERFCVIGYLGHLG